MRQRALLFLLFAVLGTFQLRFWRELYQAHQFYLYVPFVLQPFTNLMEWRAHPSRDYLHQGDHVLAVDGRKFTGSSVYAQELWKNRGTGLLQVTVHSASGLERTTQAGFAHCSCGALSSAEVFFFMILPPAFCFLLGFAVVFSYPRAPLAWLFMATMLSLCQFRLWPDGVGDFTQAADPQRRMDWMRVPTLAYRAFFEHAWGAWLLLFAAYLFGADRLRFLRGAWAAAPMFAIAATQSVLAVLWSENFEKGAAAYRALESYSTELVLAGMACTIVAGWLLSARVGLALLFVAAISLGLLYWPAPPIIRSYAVHFSDGTGSMWAVLPNFFRTSEFAQAVFATLAFLCLATLEIRSLRPLEIMSLALLGTLLIFPFGMLTGYWEWILNRALLDIAVVVGFLGLLALAWSVARRSSPDGD